MTYAVSDPLESSCLRYCLYPRVTEIIQGTRDCADSLAQRLKPLSNKYIT